MHITYIPHTYKVQERMYEWLHESGAEKNRVAIFDATNTKRERRRKLAETAREQNVFLLHVESICDDEEVLNRNYELKLQNEDYKDMDPAQALADFKRRVKAYQDAYEPIDDDKGNAQSDVKFVMLRIS